MFKLQERGVNPTKASNPSQSLSLQFGIYNKRMVDEINTSNNKGLKNIANEDCLIISKNLSSEPVTGKSISLTLY